jgi:hypothetical protein
VSFSAALALLCPLRAFAQSTQVRDAARCDSIVLAARADSVAAALFLSVGRIDGGGLSPDQANLIASHVGAAFVPPKPFRLTVFTGPPLMRSLRQLGADTNAELRAPTVSGIYRFAVDAKGKVIWTRTARASLLPGFDSSAAEAIREASIIPDVFVPPDADDSMTVEVRFSSDSSDGAQRLTSAWFPRMPVIGAVSNRSNPSPVFPEEAKVDSVTSGQVVLRFVVDRGGLPVLETIEIVRATSVLFVRAAITTFPLLRFAPATIRGCAVAQLIDYSFTFLLPEPPV